MTAYTFGSSLRRLRALSCSLALTVPLAAFAGQPSVESDHFLFVAHESVGGDDLSRLASDAEAVYERTRAFLGRAPGGDAIVCHVYSSLESKGLATGYTLPAHAYSGRGEMYVAIEPGFEGAMEQEAAVLLLRRALGRPGIDALETGLSITLAGRWRGATGAQWAQRLSGAVDDREAAVLFDNQRFRKASPLVGAILSAGFIDHALNVYGRDALLEHYARWQGDEPTVSRWLRHLRESRGDALPASTTETTSPLPRFHRGFCYAHEGYNVRDGYISRQSDDALARLAALGTNAVSITPFTYMRHPERPAPLPFSQGSGSENDESVIHASLAARELGMAVMLKPHLWLNGSWPGEVHMTSEADWNLFFEYYFDWILHYAVMSEMYKIEILCVGVELVGTTAGHEAEWIRIFDRLRRVYSGRLTYAANWGAEFENVGFWRSLDFIGVNCYYPLSEEDSPVDEALLDGANRVLDKIEGVAESTGIPVLITEVGFTSTVRPWLKPYERPRSVATDQAAQARCYELFFRALDGRSRIVGLYWWKWPSYLLYGGERHAGFTPHGKAAEAVVRRWYSEVLID